MRMTSPSITAVPVTLMGHWTGIPGPLAAAFITQLIVVTDVSVPLAVPAT
jgi:hypothetical protein